MSIIKKPMKATDFLEETLTFPKMGSYKVDGYRSFIDGGVCRMSSGKEMPNNDTRIEFSSPSLEGLDGEMVVGPWNRSDTFAKTSSALRRREGEPGAILHVFDDRSTPELAYKQRCAAARERVLALRDIGFKRLSFIEHVELRDMKDMVAFEENALAMGFEGIMLNDPDAAYKFGRSTLIEGIILKVKRFAHEEAQIVGFTEQMENVSESYSDDLGRSKKSYKKEDLIGTGMVGSFIVKSPKWPREFSISASSLSHDERKAAYEHFEDKYMAELARFKWFPKGFVDVPRHGVFDGLRDPADL